MDQRAAKILAVKVGGHKKSLSLQPLQPKYVRDCAARVRLHLGFNHFQSLTDSNFPAL